MESLHTQRNRRSPRVPNQPWRGPANLTIAQGVALFAALLVTVALWWASGLVPGAGSFWGLAARMIGTGFVGGIVALLFYAMADPHREPFIRQHVTYNFRRHTYGARPSASNSKEPTHGRVSRSQAFPFPCRTSGRARARVAIAQFTARVRAGLPRRGPRPLQRDTPPR